MISRVRILLPVSFLLLMAACASGTIDTQEPRTLVGTESKVRVTAKMIGEQVRSGAVVPLTYEVENLRSEPIAIADIVPVTDFDAETMTVTISLGSEVPGNEFLPRLVRINSGEKKSFDVGARIRIPLSIGDPRAATPRYVRLKVNFLGDIRPFEKLFDISEKAVADKALADSLFPQWVENNEIVFTNAIPIEWDGRSNTSDSDAGSRRRGIRP